MRLASWTCWNWASILIYFILKLEQHFLVVKILMSADLCIMFLWPTWKPVWRDWGELERVWDIPQLGDLGTCSVPLPGSWLALAAGIHRDLPGRAWGSQGCRRSISSVVQLWNTSCSCQCLWCLSFANQQVWTWASRSFQCVFPV